VTYIEIELKLVIHTGSKCVTTYNNSFWRN